MQFNSIYINNINKAINHSVVDATSTITKFSDTRGRFRKTAESLQSLEIKTPYFIFDGPCEWFESWSDSSINFVDHTTVYFFLYEVLSVCKITPGIVAQTG